MSKKVRVHSGATAPAELRGKIFTDGGAAEGTVLTSAAPDQAARWHQGERLDQLFEDRCDRLRDEGLGRPDCRGCRRRRLELSGAG